MADIDSDRMQIRVSAKAIRKDRYTLLAQRTMELLRAAGMRPTEWLFPESERPLTFAESVQKVMHLLDPAGHYKAADGACSQRAQFATHLLESGKGSAVTV